MEAGGQPTRAYGQIGVSKIAMIGSYGRSGGSFSVTIHGGSGDAQNAAMLDTFGPVAQLLNPSIADEDIQQMPDDFANGGGSYTPLNNLTITYNPGTQLATGISGG